MSGKLGTLGVVFARGGSKRLPRKNVRPLAGHPLVAWSCRAALASGIDRVVLSTDDDEIAEIGRRTGIDVPFRRPAALAEDFADWVDVILHAVGESETYYQETFDVIVLLQPTTPFIEPAHIDACIARLENDNLNCVFTAREAAEHPRWMWTTDDKGIASPFMNSILSADEQHHQNLTTVYYPSGAAWAIRIEAMKSQGTIYCGPHGIVEMPWERSVDIDTELDWTRAETLAAEYGFQPIEHQKC